MSALCAVLLIAQAMQAQEEPESKRAVREGLNTLNIYYGATVKAAIYKKLVSSAENVKAGMVGPIGLVYEHLVSDVIGIGAELSYMSFLGTASQVNLDPAGGTKHIYDINWSVSTLRVMFRANFHFIDDEHVDAYGFVSAGYKNTTWKVNTDNPYYKDDLGLSFNLFPFGIKPGFGFRYFFNDHFGLMTEIAAGTPLICGGASLKF